MRAAAAFAALGALLFSTGLMVLAAPSASATNTEYWAGNGSENLPCDGELHWIFTGSSDSAPVLHVDGVTETGSQGGQGNGAWHFYTTGDVEPTVTTETQQGNTWVTYTGAVDPNAVLTISHCEGDGGGEETPKDTTVDVVFTDPTCKNPTASYVAKVDGQPDGPNDHVTFTVTGTVAPGEYVKVVATADAGYTIKGASVFEHTFKDVPKYCDDEESPEKTYVNVIFKDPTCKNPTASFIARVNGENDGPDDHVTFTVTGTVAPGQHVKVVATADAGYEIRSESVFEHTFANVPEDCDGDDEETEVEATVVFREPTCANPTVGWTGSATIEGKPAPAGLVVFSADNANPTPGSTIKVTATITDDDYEFDNEDTEQVFEHTFQGVPTDCASASPSVSPSVSVSPSPSISGTASVVPSPSVSASDSPSPSIAGTESSSPKPGHQPGNQPGGGGDDEPEVLGTEAAVPTAVDAGLGALPTAAPAQGSLLGQLLTAAGGALLLAAGWMVIAGRRTVGSREA